MATRHSGAQHGHDHLTIDEIGHGRCHGFFTVETGLVDHSHVGGLASPALQQNKKNDQ